MRGGDPDRGARGRDDLALDHRGGPTTPATPRRTGGPRTLRRPSAPTPPGDPGRQRRRVSVPRDGVAEAAVVVHTRSHARAVAIRLEERKGRWRATAVGVL
ncbi:Rv3235 family protein [Curtobacterium sp. CFBP9011]|nr:Rv3235 family protein [Curtobacterium sp. CFBP9011]MDY1005013.1 Rv3235 family protein [Curtobacterium sp. CFBP9011]